MSVLITDETLRAAGLTEPEFNAEVALMLYKEERLTLGQAARLAGMDRTEFQQFLGSRGGYLNLDEEDFELDLKSLRAWGSG